MIMIETPPRRQMKPHFLTIFVTLATIYSGMAADKNAPKPQLTATTSAGGEKLPTGSWRCTYVSGNFAYESHGFTSTLTIAPNGFATFRRVWQASYKAGGQFQFGKFQGRKRITWTTIDPGNRVVRVGNEIYLYPGKARPKLVAADPPGYTLDDYESLGGVSPKNNSTSNDDIDVYRIEGKTLVLQNFKDGQRHVYSPVSAP